MLIETSLIPSGLSATVIRVVCHLAEHGPCSCTELSKALETTPQNMTGILDSAYLAGYVDRRRREDNRRTNRVTLTPKGEKFAKSLQPHK